MNIVMMTNTYAPRVGGAEKSIEIFSEDFRRLGHPTLIVTPAFESAEESSEHVLRLSAIKNVANTGYSLCLPFTGELSNRLEEFGPDLIHCHQPFHLGDSAMRFARRNNLPLIFTHHTLYERYAMGHEYESQTLLNFAKALPTEFANLCDAVIAPTPSIAQVIQQRGGTQPIHVVPTGIDIDQFRSGDRARFRKKHEIADDAMLVGNIGRLLPAKNMEYLARAVAQWLRQSGANGQAVFVGDGPSLATMKKIFADAQCAERVIFTGSLSGQDLYDAYAALDLFLFASLTDTQGLVLIEAMSAGTPVLALDATGPCDIVEHDKTGRLVDTDAPPEQYAEQINAMTQDREQLSHMAEQAGKAADQYDRARCADQMLQVYQEVIHERTDAPDTQPWQQFADRATTEWNLLIEKINATTHSLFQGNRNS